MRQIRSLFAATFDLIKARRSDWANVYVLDRQDAGGRKIAHAWNIIVLVHPDRLVFSHVDPTFYDSTGPQAFEAQRGFHIPATREALFGYFFNGLESRVLGFYYFAQALALAASAEERAALLREMSFLCILMHDRKMSLQRMALVREAFYALGLRGERYQEDDIVYYSYKVAEYAGDKATAATYRQQLVTQFPRSFWTRMLREREQR